MRLERIALVETLYHKKGQKVGGKTAVEME